MSTLAPTDLVHYLVKPDPISNPNVTDGTSSFPLYPITLWPLGSITSVHTFPGEMDPQRLQGAIAAVAAVWPNIAGRYVRNKREGEAEEYDFFIENTSSPVPFSTQTIQAEKPFPKNEVFQPTLEPYLHPLAADYYLPNKPDAALVSIRLTTLLPSKRSVLGIVWAHILGDADAFNRFINHLSYFYTHGPSARLASEQYPTFSPHITYTTYPPTEDMIQAYDIPQVAPVPLADAFAGYGKAAEESEVMKVFLTRQELKRIKDECGFADGERISQQDALSGWWTNLIERSGTKVNRICYNLNYRNMHKDHPSFSSNLPSLSANVVQMLDVKLPSSSLQHSDGLGDAIARRAQIARTIRSYLNAKRESPEKTLDWLSVIGWRLEQGAIESSAQLLVPREDEVAVNSNLRYDWNIPFGFPPDQTSHHTNITLIRMCRIFQANPRPGQQPGETDIELAFNVPKAGNAKDEVRRLVEEDRKGWAL